MRDGRGRMPGGGEMALVGWGNQNSVVSGQPSFTHFYKVFKTYAHFAQESITISLDGGNELNMDRPIHLRAMIPRNAALLKDLTFIFRIPDIYSKIVDTATPSFRWIHMLGALIIDSVAVFIGGTRVQEFPGEWIAIRAASDLDADAYAKWRVMIGDVPELHTPEEGIYGRGSYPHNVVDPSGGPTAPSIVGRELRVPLPLWFSEPGCALPLTALQLQQVEIQITLRPLRELYRIMDVETQREPLRWGQALDIDTALPTAYNPTVSPSPFDNLTLQNNYYLHLDPNGYFQRFLTDSTVPTPARIRFNLDARLEGTFVYLPKNLETMFVEREIRTLVHQVQLYQFPSVQSRQRFTLESYGLAHRVVFFGRRSDAVAQRNDYVNLSNWKNRSQPPFWPLTGGGVNSGRLINYYAEPSVLKSARLILGGTDLFEEKPADFYALQTPYHANVGSSTGVFGPLYHIPFALHASDHSQPSGALNFSRFREIQLEVEPNPLDPRGSYTFDFTVYVESMNVLILTNGTAGLQFAI